MLIKRGIESVVLEASAGYPIVSITGPRQSGKTTLARHLFPTHHYVSLEDQDNRDFAQNDPRRFISQFENGVILDEVQKTPELFSYLQTVTDLHPKAGQFILTGSQQFLLMEQISQTLAGRSSVLNLLPLSISELQTANMLTNLDNVLFSGGYPSLYTRQITPQRWYQDYTNTYLERDVRDLLNVHNLDLFRKFLILCASRVGQVLNLSNLGQDSGISHNTANSWLSVLETSHLVFRLPAYHQHFSKRLTKSPKLYFFDTGLLCNLLGIYTHQDLATSLLWGNLFENFIISELYKDQFNKGITPKGYFWRNQHGREIDFIFERGGIAYPVEIKSSETLRQKHLKNLTYWTTLNPKSGPTTLIYGGNQNQTRSNINVLKWKSCTEIYNLTN